MIMTAATATLQPQFCPKALSACKASRNCKHTMERRRDRPTKLRLERSDSSKENKSGKRVSFVDKNLAVTVQFPSTAEDVKMSWYTDTDYETFQSDCRTTVTAFVMARERKEKGEKRYHLDGSKFTARGLEDMLTKESSELRGYRKRLHAHHVLKQQYLQRCEGLDSPDWIKSVSEKYSAASCESARQRGNRRTPSY